MLSSLTATQIPCCLCGTMIYPNAANQCATCLSQNVNLQDYIQGRGTGRGTGSNHTSTHTSTSTHTRIDDKRELATMIQIHQCRNCRRFQRNEKCWEHADHESSQLMSICLKHIPALQHNHHPHPQSATSTGSTTTSSSSASSSSSSTIVASNTIGPLRLIDAQWIWTEPHCMRYKIRCTVQTEIHNVRVQQRVVVVLQCVFQMCIECTREFNHRTWQSVVQLRQKISSLSTSSEHQQQSSSSSSSSSKGSHKNANGLMILEQALAKNKEIRKHVLKIDQATNHMGYDFYFLSIPHAQTFVSFLQRILPMRVRTSKKLVSTDAHSSHVANMKHTMMCDMVPLTIYDLIVIHKSTSKCKLAGHLVVVTKLASVIHFINVAPQRQRLRTIMTTQQQQSKNTTNVATNTSNNNNNNNNMAMIDDCTMELSAETYYKQGGDKQYSVVQSSHRLVRFVVLDVELLSQSFDHTNTTRNTNTNSSSSSSATNNSTTTRATEQKQQYAMAEVLVARESDMGMNDRTFTTISHLGQHIEAGDIVLGYDLSSSSTLNLDDDEMKDQFYSNFIMPEIVLVKKAPPVVVSTANDGDGNNNKNKKKSQLLKSGRKSNSRNSNNNNSVRSISQNKNNESQKNKQTTQRKRRPNDEKRSRELEERAKRMGFIPEETDDGVDEEKEYIDNDATPTARTTRSSEHDEQDGYDDDNSTVPPFTNDNDDIDDDDMLYDTVDLMNEVLVLERDFETLTLQQQQQKEEQLSTHDSVDGDDEQYEAEAIIDNNSNDDTDTDLAKEPIR